MGTTIQPQAVVAGNINYFTSVSTGISAAVAGLPLVIVISFCDSSPWVLVTHKDINKPQDLSGKTVALSGIRTSPYYFFQAFLKKFEMSEKDVGIISTGGTADSFRALTSNRVVGDFDAAVRRQGGVARLQKVHTARRPGGYSLRRIGYVAK
jgi:ABC-type nitrate/sulfonate/bicarbonate transport system substrate-binding protein